MKKRLNGCQILISILEKERNANCSKVVLIHQSIDAQAHGLSLPSLKEYDSLSQSKVASVLPTVSAPSFWRSDCVATVIRGHTFSLRNLHRGDPALMGAS